MGGTVIRIMIVGFSNELRDSPHRLECETHTSGDGDRVCLLLGGVAGLGLNMVGELYDRRRRRDRTELNGLGQNLCLIRRA